MMELQKRSWLEVIDIAWKLQALAEAKAGGNFDCRTAELFFGPSVAESLIRNYGSSVSKLVPMPAGINDAYMRAKRKGKRFPASLLPTWGRKKNLLIDYIFPADALSERFAAISGDRSVAVSSRLNACAQVICCLAHELEPIARQEFQQEFAWDQHRREWVGVFNADEQQVWWMLEEQAGVGILASVWHAKQFMPDLTPKEFVIALLRKYGIPASVNGSEVYACHWCGTAPCSCGGGKAPKRHVTPKDAESNLHRGPLDTQKGMYFPYAWANIARGGVGYGPFRALVEVAVEKGAILVEPTLPSLKQKFGPLFLQHQKYFKEFLQSIEGGEAAIRKARLSELADAVHWQFLNGPGLIDHVSGMAMALERVAKYCGVDIETLK